jgi:hypothetical protein
MTDQHPITPPPELVEQWDEEGTNMLRPAYQTHLCTQAARWGADQELEACLKWMGIFCATWTCGRRPEDVLRSNRRPKPPTLKEQALAKLAELESDEPVYKNDLEVLRRALEALPND